MPASDNPVRDNEIFLKILSMDEEDNEEDICIAVHIQLFGSVMREARTTTAVRRG